ncbi:protein starmaker [Scaptodrosophila lebanonensis]|uniref:Protein starmaker n=1 Tax=Drosophila lebanonensis TaxID=7225 RepID=A0A6J2TEV1_DROLE|nr:protein starmaker [Scaptodrosophila lebanonensis]
MSHGKKFDYSQIRGEMHVRVLELLRDKLGKSDKPLCGHQLTDQDERVLLLNKLIMEYLNWYGYKHTMETFSMETGASAQPPERRQLEADLGTELSLKGLPILLELFLNVYNRKPRPQQQFQQSSHHIESKTSVGQKSSSPRPIKLHKSTSPYNLMAGELASTQHIASEGPERYQAVCERLIKEQLLQNEQSSKVDSSLNSMQSLVQSKRADKPKEQRSAAGDDSQIQVSHHGPVKDSGNQTEFPKELDHEIEKAPQTVNQELQQEVSDEEENENSYDSGSSDSSHTDTNVTDEEVDDSYDSDMFADVPEGHYYEEMESPEEAYPPGYGEEGCYVEGHSNRSELEISITSQADISTQPSTSAQAQRAAHNEAKAKGDGKSVQSLDLDLCNLVDSVKEDVKAHMKAAKRDAKRQQQRYNAPSNRLSTVISTVQLDSDEDEDDYDNEDDDNDDDNHEDDADARTVHNNAEEDDSESFMDPQDV